MVDQQPLPPDVVAFIHAHINSVEQLEVLLNELGRYQPELLERPRLVVGSKADAATQPWDGERVSAATGEGVRPLLGRLITESDPPPGPSSVVVLSHALWHSRFGGREDLVAPLLPGLCTDLRHLPTLQNRTDVLYWRDE